MDVMPGAGSSIASNTGSSIRDDLPGWACAAGEPEQNSPIPVSTAARGASASSERATVEIDITG